MDEAIASGSLRIRQMTKAERAQADEARAARAAARESAPSRRGRLKA